jgi:hypothetical protein
LAGSLFSNLIIQALPKIPKLIYLNLYFFLKLSKCLNPRLKCSISVAYNQERKLLRQPHKCPPHPQFNVVWMTEKRKFNPLFPTLIMGAGRRTLKWPKMRKVSLFLHAIVVIKQYFSHLSHSIPSFDTGPANQKRSYITFIFKTNLSLG